MGVGRAHGEHFREKNHGGLLVNICTSLWDVKTWCLGFASSSGVPALTLAHDQSRLVWHLRSTVPDTLPIWVHKPVWVHPKHTETSGQQPGEGSAMLCLSHQGLENPAGVSHYRAAGENHYRAYGMHLEHQQDTPLLQGSRGLLRTLTSHGRRLIWEGDLTWTRLLELLYGRHCRQTRVERKHLKTAELTEGEDGGA